LGDKSERQVRSPTLKTFSTHAPEATSGEPEKFVTGASPAKQCGSSALARILESRR
jgi:hypothetical protein